MIGSEAEFEAEAGPVLADLLPRAAEELVSAAQRHPSPASIGLAREMWSLAGGWIPAGQRPMERLGRIEAALALMQYKAASEPELQRAVAAIRRAIAIRDYAEAHRARTALLAAYPELADRDDLAQAAQELGRAEQSAVTWVARPAAAGEAAPSPLATVIVAGRVLHGEAPGTEGGVVFAVAAGVVYGLDAPTGKVLWRRYVGPNPGAAGEGFMPRRLDSQPGGDVILTLPVRGQSSASKRQPAGRAGGVPWANASRPRPSRPATASCWLPAAGGCW